MCLSWPQLCITTHLHVFEALKFRNSYYICILERLHEGLGLGFCELLQIKAMAAIVLQEDPPPSMSNVVATLAGCYKDCGLPSMLNSINAGGKKEEQVYTPLFSPPF